LFNISSNNGSISFIPTDDDEGIYSINISVNDSSGQVASELISFTVVFINNPPNIDSYTPTNLNPSVFESSTLDFSITMSDPEETIPSVQWYLDVSEVGDDSTSYTYGPNYNDAGTHNVTVIITDGELYDSIEWSVDVKDKSPPLAGAGGGGGGGGGFSCTERWNCSDWSPCQYPGIQIRTCSDASNCGTVRFKPGDRLPCEFKVIETCFDGVKNQDEILVDCGGICNPCPTCDDNIKNQGEVETDCGGPCPGCPRVEKPARIVKELCGNGKIDNFKEIFNCFKDSWWVWLIMLILLLVLAIRRKRKRIIKSTGVEKIKLDKERVAKIKRLIGVAGQALRNRQISKLKVTCDRIEILYNSLSSDRSKNKVFKKIKKLNNKINKFET